MLEVSLELLLEESEEELEGALVVVEVLELDELLGLFVGLGVGFGDGFGVGVGSIFGLASGE